jgi:hypothetical protein
MDAIHYEVTEVIRIAARLNLVHHVYEELITYLEGFQIITFHAFLNGCDLDHTESNHEHLSLRWTLQSVKDFVSQQLELFRCEKRHRSRILQHNFIWCLSLLQKEWIYEFSLSVLVHKDAANFDIAVHRPFPMQVLQTLYHFPKYPAYFLLRDRLFIFTTILNFVKQTIGI